MSVVDRFRKFFWAGDAGLAAQPPDPAVPVDCEAIRAKGRMLLSDRDRTRMHGVHADLVRMVEHARGSGAQFMVLEGLRTEARQRELFKKGATKTLNSRHLTGHAVDIAPLLDGAVRWDWPLYHAMAPIVKAAAEAEGVVVEWGGDWQSFPDGPHWQLPWDRYP